MCPDGEASFDSLRPTVFRSARDFGPPMIESIQQTEVSIATQIGIIGCDTIQP
jgi:hypothetical protein